jgi:Domain of unknown function (DUF1707)/Domain of unknown function (DUF4190)
MSAGGGRPIRAADADREKVQSLLADAYAEGRLSWNEFDARSTALVTALTYDQLSALTIDLPGWMPSTPPPVYLPVTTGLQRTNGMAVASLVCGISAFPLSFLLLGPIPAIAAIILGHRARRQIRRTGEAGAGAALAGALLGYLCVGLFVLVIIGVIAGSGGQP